MTISQFWSSAMPNKTNLEGEFSGDVLLQNRVNQLEKEMHETVNRYLNLLDSIPIIIFEGNPEWETLTVNRYIEVVTGYPANEFKNDKDQWFKIIHPDDKERVQEEVIKIVDHQCTITQIYRIIRKDGGIRWVEDTKTSIFESGEFMSLYGTIRDITEKIELEKQKLLEQKFEILETAAGGVAHDFNNILVSILGNIELLETTKLTGKQDKYTNDLKEAALNAVKLSYQLLNFSKGDKPTIKLHSITELIKTVAEYTIHEFETSYNLIFEKELPMVQIDQRRIEHVISNIILNSIQAMSGGGHIDIAVSKSHIEDEVLLTRGEYVVIEIKDHGHGISNDIKDKIFTPYFSTKPESTGLGLATSYSIMRKHSGLIKFKSNINEGTTFTVYIPTFEMENNTEIINQQSKRLSMKNGSKNEKFRIIVMDDHQMIHNTLQNIFELMNIEMISTYKGEELIEKYQEALREKTPFDAVIMDLTIPGGIGGKETIGPLRAIDPHVKVIVSSGYSEDPVMSDYKKYGFDGILPKPYSIEMLKNVLNELIGYS